jgi:hypothetical protein
MIYSKIFIKKYIERFFIKFLIIFLILVFFFSRQTFSENLNIKSKNFQNIYKKKDILFFEECFFNQISNNFLKKKDFVFANSYGEIFLYNFSLGQSVKILNLKDFVFSKGYPNCKNFRKYRFKQIEIIRVSENHFMIFLENLIFFFQKKDKNNFLLKWKFSSLYPINLNTIILKNNNIIFSKVNNIIESRKIVDGSVNWFFQDSSLRSIKISSQPILFLNNDKIFSFFSNGKILKFNLDDGLIFSSLFISKKKTINQIFSENQSHNFYYIPGFYSSKTKLNFSGKNIIAITSFGQVLIDIQAGQIIYKFKEKSRFQEVIYLDDEIYAVYKNQFLMKISPDLKIKYFKIPHDICKLNFKDSTKMNFSKRNDYFIFHPNVSIIQRGEEKFLMFAGKKNKPSFFYFDKKRERFISDL